MRIKIETYGCSANYADSEFMIDSLSKEFEVVEKNPDLLIVNTCGVKGPTEEKIVNRLREATKGDVLVAGCLPRINFDRLYMNFPNFSFIGPHQIARINEIARRISSGEHVIEIGFEGHEAPFKSFSFSPVVGIVPISEGCLGNCSYCAAKLARGDLISYPTKSIKRQVEHFVRSGKKEVWITSQDTGAYGKDTGTNLVELISDITKIPMDFLVRVGMMNPNHFNNSFVEIFKNPKVFKFAHIPIQSGSDKVLEEMNRFYTVGDFKRIVRELRKQVSGISISTDIICGYPTETNDDWEKTIDLVKWLDPDVLNISKFYPRPNTKAKGLRKLDTKTVSARSRELSGIFEKILLKKNKEWLGWEGDVLIDEDGKGRNIFYKPVIAKGLFGETKKVRIDSYTPTSLVAEN
jgi:threonylcarbamoyladenosine tRNA methylthiotransferase CDKAL1